MKKFLFIIQIFIKCSLIFLIAFIWLRFVLDSIWLALSLSFIITVIIELITTFFKRKNGIKNSLQVKEKEDAENMFLSLLQDKNRIDFFCNLVSSRHSNIRKNKNYILISHDNKTKVALFPFFKIQSLLPDNIIEINNEIKEKLDKLVIVCNDYDKSSLDFSKHFSFEIVILNKYETYQNLYKEYDYYPEIIVKNSTKKISFKELISYSFNRSRTKGYIISSLLLFIMSFFVQMSIYYCIVASILLIFALISFTNQTYNKKIEKELL